MIDLQTLTDRIEIERVIHLYAHYLDSGKLDRIATEVFSEDGDIDFGGINVRGRAAIHAHILSYDGSLLGCSHNISNLIIEIDGDEARATSRVLAWHWFALPDADPMRPTDLLAVGGYEDRLKRTDEGWRISQRKGMNFGTGVGAGTVPEPLRPVFEGMRGRRPDWPA